MNKNNQTPTLSVVTPTYNRGQLLNNCFESLRAQSCFDFEWIIVNDGSTDDTRSVMNRIMACDVPFPVCCVHKDNGGKHTALNAAHPYIHGRYVLLLDSDDTLMPDAVETVLAGWAEFENRRDVAMVTFLKQTTDGRICAYAKDERVPTDVLRYPRICVASSDCCEVIRTELFKKYPFPVFEGERFLAETALWYRAGLDGSNVYINKSVYLCEYLADGLTKSGKSLRIRNPRGGMYTSLLRMNKRCTLKERIKAGMLYMCYGNFAGVKTGALIVSAAPYRLLAALCAMPGKAMYVFWKKKYLRG